MTPEPPTSIEYRPIGVVHSPFTEPAGTPIQPSRAAGITGTVEVFPEFAAGLADLDGFSHIILLCHLHRSSGCRMTVVPFLDTEPRGLFATRAPCRPNPIGLSVVRLLSISGATLTIEGVDLLDGTPVLDIKPFVGEFDRATGIRTGWLEAARARQDRADDRFSRPASRAFTAGPPPGSGILTREHNHRSPGREARMIEKATDTGYREVVEGVFLKALVHGERTLLTEVRLKKGAVVPEHRHPHEQTGYLLSGSLRFFSGDDEEVAAAGDSWNLASDVPHGAEALEDTVVVEVFSPVREDYLTG